MTPREIVSELDKYIVGQDDAKRAVAIALRNRWRRARVPEPLHSEITPKNILMIGPTGVGKTEIARRLARLTDAPFVKTEATKFTEVGYVGRNVESIIRDLMESGMKLMREQQKRRVHVQAAEAAENRVLNLLVPPTTQVTNPDGTPVAPVEGVARRRLREDLRAGRLDEKVVEAEVPATGPVFNMIAPEGMDDMENQLQNVFEKLQQQQKEKRRLKVKELLEIYTEEEAGKLVDKSECIREAVDNVENNGIVFIDEIDKIARGGEVNGADASLVKQYEALLAADGCKLLFDDEAIKLIAQYAFDVNEHTENIGARRLHTVMEKLLEDASFAAGNCAESSFNIDAAYVRERLGPLTQDEDLSRYVL